MKPLILFNFKNYKEACGEKALYLAREAAKVKRPQYTLAVAPPLLTTKEVCQKVKLPVYAQYADPISYGAQTGKIVPAELKAIGCKGVIINHSEYSLSLSQIESTIHFCKQSKLQTVVCVQSLSLVKKVAPLHPDIIAYEPPALIGGKISVTQAKPSLIVKAVELVKTLSPKTRLLCGAGIHSSEDVGQALLLGASGVLIGHAFPKAKDPKKYLENLLL